MQKYILKRNYGLISTKLIIIEYCKTLKKLKGILEVYNEK